MIEGDIPSTAIRHVNIDAAIDRSSFQLPVFVAISVAGGEDQVVKTFDTARDVFDHVFSILLDRIRQRRAVEKVEHLVPASASIQNSHNTEYVLFVRGRAIFWFSSAAAKRSAGRRLLLEHARELAEAEQTPFYKLNTLARKRWALAIALGVAALAAILTFFFRYPFARAFSVKQSVAAPLKQTTRSLITTSVWQQQARPLRSENQFTSLASVPSAPVLPTQSTRAPVPVAINSLGQAMPALALDTPPSVELLPEQAQIRHYRRKATLAATAAFEAAKTKSDPDVAPNSKRRPQLPIAPIASTGSKKNATAKPLL